MSNQQRSIVALISNFGPEVSFCFRLVSSRQEKGRTPLVAPLCGPSAFPSLVSLPEKGDFPTVCVNANHHIVLKLYVSWSVPPPDFELL